MASCVFDEPGTSSIESLAQSHAVVPEKELVITDPSVIAAPQETTFDPAHPSGTTKFGAWSFGRLVHNMLPASQRDSAASASQLVLQWLATWETDQAPNPLVSPAKARPAIRLMITNPWKQASGCVEPADPATDATCVLDMTKAPFKLMAIVYRPDLRIVAGNDSSIGGEGRFVFQVIGPTLGVNPTTGVVVTDPTPAPQKFTVIFEYSLPVTDDGQIITWAEKWHQLGTKPFATAFNAHLLTLTRDFSGPDADTRRPNGNALDQVRTNEVPLTPPRRLADQSFASARVWELREFRLTTTGLTPHTVNLEPARDFDIGKSGQSGAEGTRSSELGAFLSTNAAFVLQSRHVFPAEWSANSALVGAASPPYNAWGTPEGVTSQVRDLFALNTCSGCHKHETNTNSFMHVSFAGALNAIDRPANTADTQTVLSTFLANQVNAGGERFNDFTALLTTQRKDLRDKPGVRACR